MKKRYFIVLFFVSFLIEFIIIISSLYQNYNFKNDTVKINDLVHEIELNYNNPDKYPNYYNYSIIDFNGELVYKNDDKASSSLNEAYRNRDTIVDINVFDNQYKVLIVNDIDNIIQSNNQRIILTLISISIIQFLIIALYYLFLYKDILKPFYDLKKYATRVASGNLDIPLKMDKSNNFGAFTESFDIMREELKKARIKEKEANDSKRELVAKLSHDIKTPIASIKSSSELGSLIALDSKSKYYFDAINNKTDQINSLVSNLLVSSLEDLDEIKVSPQTFKSYVLYDLISNSDYLNKIEKYSINECNLYMDRLRLQQVFDNIISNSYKYANTNITIKSKIEDEYLVLDFRDYGDGVLDYELPLLMEKYKRGNNSKDKDGVGLGLYISSSFLKAMDGILEINNDNPGFRVTVKLRII